jgi:cell division protease FtsH
VLIRKIAVALGKLGRRFQRKISEKPVLLLAVFLPTLIAVLAVVLVLNSSGPVAKTPASNTAAGRAAETGVAPTALAYSSLVRKLDAGKATSAHFDPSQDQLLVVMKDGQRFSTYYPDLDESRLANQLTAQGAKVSLQPAGSGGGGTSMTPYVIVGILFVFFLIALVVNASRRAQGAAAAGGRQSLFSHSKTRGAELVIPDTRFGDVAGCDEAVQEVAEMVDFLKNPDRYALTGAKMPAGIVLHGQPGTGKTLLAKAVAGESGVPFFAASGSDFVEMYVGVGASRVRNLFEQARKAAPAVLFIDEIDAVGKKRGSGAAGGNDEREGTLNQILVELDGFAGRDGLVVMAATNRLDTLDPALLRPGRLSRHVQVGLPSKEGRLAILQVHSRTKPLDVLVDLPELAAFTAGSSGAELAEMVNEGAIMAARDRSAVITQAHLREGFLRVIAGPRKASATLAVGERETIAYHEAGHVLCGELCETIDKTIHATINPRGQAAGFAVTGRTDRSLQDEQHIHEQLIHILGGRAAEHVINGTVSSGAANDLERANEIARMAVERLGLSPEFGQVITHARGLSEEMTALSDREVRRMVDDAYRDAVALVTEHAAQLEAIAQALLTVGDIDRPEIVAAMNGADPKARKPRQPMAPVFREPAPEGVGVSAPVLPEPAPTRPEASGGRARRKSQRLRGSFAGELTGAVRRSVAQTVAARRARKGRGDLAL